ncbi:MAG TPA: GspH/FimT family pseudopilin [Noviherbaspirillum sp.]
MLRQRGMSLIELMIGVAIMAILLMTGIPSFSLWIQNTQNRAAAESILNGLQLARAEAVRRNTVVRFELTDTSGLVAWTVGCENVTAECPATIQQRASTDGSVNARVGVSSTAIPSPTPSGYFGTAIAAGAGVDGGDAGVSFNGIGRVPSINIGVDITRVDITNAVLSGARRYVVIIGTGGQIRMCDPAVAFSGNPQGCS